jgi:ABC-type transport system substrate-binding protein
MRQTLRNLLPLALAVALLAACGKDDAPEATADAPAAAAPEADPKKDEGGLFDFMNDDAPAEVAGPDLGAFKLESVTLGTALDADNNVREGKTVFSPKDPIHAAVLSSGEHPGLTLVAHWTAADGTVVAHSEQPVVATGPTVTTFSLRNSAPWPPGLYQLAVQVEGKTLQSRAFEVVEPQALR